MPSSLSSLYHRIPPGLISTAKYLLAGVLLYLIFRKTDVEGLKTTYRTTAGWTIPLAIFITYTVMSLQALRLWILIRAQSPGASFFHTLKCHYISSFYSTFLPSSVAIDVVRGYLLSRSVDTSVVWGATWIYKVIYLLAWVLFALGGLIALGGTIAGYNLYPLVGLLAAVLLASISLSFSKRLSAPLRRPVSRVLGPRISERLSDIRQSIYGYRSHPWSLILGAVVTLLIQLLFIFGTVIIIFGITGQIYVGECFLFLPLIDIVTVLLPLTPNGFGIREALYAVMFDYLHLSGEQLAIFVLLSTLSFVLRAVGVFPLLWDTVRNRVTRKSTDA